MAGPGSVQVPPDSTGKIVDMVSATVGGVSVARQVFALANGADGQTIAEVIAASASTGAVGVVVRPTTATVALVAGSTVGINSIGTVTVDGTVNISSMPAIGVSIGAVAISGTAIVSGNINISAMPTVTVTGGVAVSGTAIVAGVVGLTAGTALIGAVSNAPGTALMGAVSLAAGTAVIGDINAISRTVQVAIGTPFVVQGISTTIQAAIATPFTLQGISTTVNTATRLVTGGAYDNTAGDALKVLIVGGGTGGGTVTLSSGSITRISNTVIVAVSTPFTLQGISTTVQVAGNITLTPAIDKQSYTAAQATVFPMGGIHGDAYTAATASQVAAVRITSARAMHVQLRGNDGTTFDDTAGTALRTTVVNAINVNGGVAISGTAQVAIGTPIVINNISATTVVSGLLSVTGTVQVAIATPYTLQGISTTVQVAVATPFILQGISTTVQVAVATPFILQGISTTVSTVCNITAVSAGVAINTQARAPAVMSASRGPKCVTASTSANVTLIATPGAGANIYIKQLGCHNFSGTFIAMRVGTSSSTQTIVVPAQSSGGGAIYNFDPPWMLSASEAALCSVKPNANYGVFNVQFYVI